MKSPVIISIILFASLSSCAFAGQTGDFNAVQFGTPYILMADDAPPSYAPQLSDGKTDSAVSVPASGSVQVEWRHPRDVYLVRLVFAGSAPKPEDVQLKWWRRIWPDNGEGGWLKLDDPFNGGFVTAAVEAKTTGDKSLEFRFKPLNTTEVPGITETGFNYRTTYKIRILLKVPARLAEFECYTDSKWKNAQIKVEMIGQKWDGKVEARNAVIESVTPMDGSSALVYVRYADNPNRLSPDRGYVVVRRGGKGQDFSFFVDDVINEGSIYVRDINALIFNALRADMFTPEKRPPGSWDATIMERVASMPEQTFDRAMKEIPRKWIDHAHMGLPVLRQEMSISNFNQIYKHSKSLRGIGSDVAVSPQFPGEWSEISFAMITRKSPFAPPGPNRIKRWLEEGYLPVVHSSWRDDNVDYYQTIFVTALDPVVLRKSLEIPKPAAKPIGSGEHAANFGSDLRGDEPVAALSRLEITNPDKSEQAVHVWFRPPKNVSINIEPDGLIVQDKPTKPSAGEGLTPVWGQIDIRGRGELAYIKNLMLEGEQPNNVGDVIQYTIRLAPGEKYTIYVKVPFIEQMTKTEVAQFRALNWEQSHKEVADLWKKRLAKAIESYRVPELMITNLYRSNLWHALIGTDRDPSTGLYEHGAGTYAYPMYANETMMVARMLDMRGEHEEARRLVEPYLVSQGQRSLPGNFKSKDGLLYAAAPSKYDHYTAQGYNMHHGFILWAAAEHYLWTRDKKYLRAVAPNLIAACDWITRERKATMVINPDGTKPIEYGLAPAGDLEDVDEYLYFYATNAYYYLGMKTTADTLAEIKHPEAARIAADTKAYADDIMASVRESTATSPVIKLLDGTYIPYVPPRAYALTDRKEGWIRESLYCALHLQSCGLIKPDDQLTTWILNDLEDRIFMSKESGRLPEKLKMSLEDYWFPISGFNPQPNLLDNSIAYLQRGQVPNFVRAFFNIFSGSIYPDTVCFSECAQPYAQGGGPVYKTPDESKFIQFMRQMLVIEMGSDLYIGRGVPKEWMANGKTMLFKDAPTYFGPMNAKISSYASKGKIIAYISLPTRNPAKRAIVCLHHPEGKKIKSVTVNGKAWKNFDPQTGEVKLPGTMGKVSVVALY